jgi:hypothetical protein
MAVETRFLDDDIIGIPTYAITSGFTKEERLRTTTLFWGDQVRIIGQHDGQHIVEFTQQEWSEADHRYKAVKYAGLLPKKARFRDGSVLKVRFVDVGQGDGAMIETPKG